MGIFCSLLTLFLLILTIVTCILNQETDSPKGDGKRQDESSITSYLRTTSSVSKYYVIIVKNIAKTVSNLYLFCVKVTTINLKVTLTLIVIKMIILLLRMISQI